MKNFQNKAKIIKVSKILRNIAFAGLVLWGIMIPASLATAILPPLFSGQFSFPISAFLTVPMFVFAFLTNLKIFQFLDRLKNGCFFDTQTVGNLNAAGTWWLMMWLYEVVYCALGQTLCADPLWSNPVDFSHFPPDLGGLFGALILKFFAWLFREAQELQEEQELTV